jgi:hypothetical protein
MFTDNIIRDVAIGCGWSIIMTLGFIGLGSCMLLLINKKEQPEWLKATLGAGTFIILGTILDYYSQSTRINLVTILFLGVGFWIITGGIRNLWKTLKYAGISGIVLIAVATYIACLGANNWMYDANWDDASGYWPVCHEMSVSGQSYAPLSFRRILAWGGQYPPQMLGMLFTSDLGGAIYDRSVGAWIGLLLVLYAFRNSRSSALVPIAGSFLIALPQTALNSAPAVLPAFFFCALYLERKNIWIASLTMGAIALTRTQLIVPTAIIGLLAIWDLYKSQGIKASIKYTILVPIITALFCLASMLLHHQMYGTYSVFINPGPVNKDYISFTGHIEHLASNAWSFAGASPELATILGLIILQLSSRMAIISLITMGFFLATMPEYSIVEFRRYAWPVFSATLYLSTIIGWKNHKAIITIMLVACSYYPLSMLTTYYKKAGEGFEKSLGGEYYWQKGPKAQTKVPEGRTIIWVSGQPALLDYGRNKIINWDSFPAVGNSPKSTEPSEWRKWGQIFNADYLVVEEFIPALKKLWVGYEEPGSLKHYTRVWYPDRERGIDLLKNLEKTLPTYKYNGYVFYDLRPEGSPYELDIPIEEINNLREEEREDASLNEKWKKIEEDYKKERKEWEQRRLKAQEKRDKARLVRNRLKNNQEAQEKID